MADNSLTRSDNDAHAHAHAREAGELTDVQLRICERIMVGESVLAICRDDDMPSRSTVMSWVAKDLTFRAAYLAAKAMLAETLAEEIIEIGDDSSADWVETEDGKELDREHVQRSKLRCDNRKWLAARLAPKRYGEASMMRIGEPNGPDGRQHSETEMFTRLAAIAARVSKGSD